MRPFSETDVLLSITPRFFTSFPVIATLARAALMRPLFTALPAYEGMMDAGSVTAPT